MIERRFRQPTYLAPRSAVDLGVAADGQAGAGRVTLALKAIGWELVETGVPTSGLVAYRFWRTALD